MARRRSFTSQLYRAARISNNISAVASGKSTPRSAQSEERRCGSDAWKRRFLRRPPRRRAAGAESALAAILALLHQALHSPLAWHRLVPALLSHSGRCTRTSTSTCRSRWRSSGKPPSAPGPRRTSHRSANATRWLPAAAHRSSAQWRTENPMHPRCTLRGDSGLPAPAAASRESTRFTGTFR